MSISNREIVERLAGSKLFCDYARAFAIAIGEPLDFVPVEDGHPCRLTGGAAAPRADLSNGPPDSMVPVRLGERWIGNLCLDWAFPLEPLCVRTGRTATLRERPAIRDLPGRASAARHQAAISLLEVFAEHLAMVGNRMLLEAKSAEPRVIARVKQFVAQRLTEDIKLADAARLAHMSTCYFCRVFRCATGLSFTNYLSRMRIERARTRLLDRQVRVSEIAFEIGFQSLSQFNRVFKRVVGECPTGYRRGLAVHGSSAGQPRAASAPAPGLSRRPTNVRGFPSANSRFVAAGA